MLAPEQLPATIAQYERSACECLDENAWAYLSGGAGDEYTVRWNRDAFAKWMIVPRVLRAGTGSAEIYLLGERYAHPLIVAPIAYQKLFHADGEVATAQAASAQDAVMALSTLASCEMERVAQAGAACRWFQLYMQPRREDTASLISRAEAAEFEAIVVTVDAPISGVRDRERSVGFQLPPGISAVNLSGLGALPDRVPPDASAIFGYYACVAPSWSDIEWLIGATRLPVIVKGIASPADAILAFEAGASAIVVSNHGGRVVDTMPASIDLLPSVADRIAGRIPIVLDGGIRRGSDVFKALALGATAVMIGRPVMHGLAVAGALGASHVIRLIRDEFEITMALAGCLTVEQISSELLTRAA